MKVFHLAGIKLTLDESEDLLTQKTAEALSIKRENIISLQVIKKTIDEETPKIKN